MLRKCLVVLGLLAFAMPAQAGVFGSAFQKVTDAQIQIFDTSLNGGLGDWRIAVSGAPGSGADIAIVAIGETSESFAQLNGVFDFNFAPSLDVGPAYVDEALATGVGGPGDNLGFTPGVDPPGATISYAFADTEGLGGSLVDTGDAAVQLIASTNVDKNGIFTQADSNSNLNSSLTTRLVPYVDAQFRFVANVEVDLDAVIAPPPGLSIIATSRLQMSVDGSSAGNPNTNLNFEPAAANATFSAGVTSSYYFNGTVTSGAATLYEGGTYDFDITSAVSVETVPEPSSALVFGAVGICGLIGRRRRK